MKCEVPIPTEKIECIPEISIKTFVDARRPDNPRFLFYKDTQRHGKTLAEFTSDGSSVADFITAIVKETAQKAGIRIVNNSDFVISGKVLSLESVLMSDMRAKLDTILHSQIQLTKGTQTVSKETFVDRGSAEVGFDRDYEEALEKMFNNFSASVLDFLKSVHVPGPDGKR